jgi:large subunit ribosomal protein L30
MTNDAKKPLAWIVLRVRGTWGTRVQTADTLRQLRLARRYHATVIPASPAYRGMLHEATNYLAWCPADAATVTALLSKRGLVTGGKKLTDAFVEKHSSFKTIAALAAAVADGKARLTDVKGLKPVFRLQPPQGGHGKAKRLGPESALGAQGAALTELVARML